MAPRGKKTEAETEATKVATQPAETSTPASDLSTAPGETSDAAPLGQDDSAADGDVVGAEVVTGRAAADAEAAAAAASTAAASEVLGAILDQAKETPAATDQPSDEPERREFYVLDPVSHDGREYEVGEAIAITQAMHADLLKAGVIEGTWDHHEVVAQ